MTSARFPDPLERPTLTVREAGEWMGIGPDLAYDAVKRGEIPSIRCGRRLLIPTAALARLLGLDGEPAPAGEPGSLALVPAPLARRLG